MARSQIRSVEALKKMRERQRELDREDDERREARRERIAAASASATVALGRYGNAVAAVEAGVLLRGAHVALHSVKLPADCGVDAMNGDDDPPAQAEALAERPLPEADSLGVR